jgi:hypothetical protein
MLGLRHVELKFLAVRTGIPAAQHCSTWYKTIRRRTSLARGPSECLR